jgi:hypothetical protein
MDKETEIIEADDIRVRIKQFEEDLEELLKKHDLSLQITEDFPVYRLLPEEVQLALAVLKKHGMQYKFSYTERTKNPQS